MGRFLFLCLCVSVCFAQCRPSTDDVPPVIGTKFDDYDAIVRDSIGNVLTPAVNAELSILSRHENLSVYEYVESIWNMALNTPAVTQREVFHWKIQIIHPSEKAYTLMLPNGHFYISTKLLRFIESESQLLSLLAHEIYFAESDKGALQMENAFGETTMGDIYLNNEFVNLSTIATQLPTIVNSEESVLEADEFSVELLCPFAYEPRGILSIIEKANESEENLAWLEQHYAPLDERTHTINQAATTCGVGGVENIDAYQFFKNDLPE